VDESEFEGVPGYLKGRSSVERVNEAIKELNGLLSSRQARTTIPLSFCPVF
jgi:hypothetical protein